METAKSQLRLRSLDVGGRSIGTDRPSLVPSEGADFLTRLNQDLSEVQQGEARIRRERDEAAQERTAERDARTAQEQKAGESSEAQRRAADDKRAQARESADQIEERQATRQANRRAESEGRADEQRAQSHARRTRPSNAEDSRVTRTEGHEQRDLEEAAVPNTPQTHPRPTSDAGAAARATTTQPTQGQPAPMPAGAASPTAVGAASVASAAAPRSAVGQASTAQPASPASAVQAERTQRSAAAPQAPRSAPSVPDLDRAEAVLRQVKVALRPGLRSATIQLHPAELGRISIRVRVQDEGVHAVVRAESEGALSVLERHLPELRAMLAQQGFESAEFDLGLASQGDGPHDQDSSSGRAAGENNDDEIDLDPIALARPLAAAEGGVDLIA